VELITPFLFHDYLKETEGKAIAHKNIKLVIRAVELRFFSVETRENGLINDSMSKTAGFSVIFWLESCYILGAIEFKLCFFLFSLKNSCICPPENPKSIKFFFPLILSLFFFRLRNKEWEERGELLIKEMSTQENKQKHKLETSFVSKKRNHLVLIFVL
jgi:hypothetical protein